jgi:hypothetical protein
MNLAQSSSDISYESWELDISVEGLPGSPYTLNYFANGTFTAPYGMPPCIFADGDCMGTYIWQLIGILFQARYWLYLADFGQIAPTLYPWIEDTGTLDPEIPTITNASVSTSTNNIFVNSVLYENSKETISTDSFLPIPAFNSSSGLFPLQQDDSVVLSQSYYCQKRQPKGALNLFITVIAADYALIMGGYTLVVFIASWIEKRRQEGTKDLSWLISRVAANYCEGCFQPVPSEDPGEAEEEPFVDGRGEEDGKQEEEDAAENV